LPQTKLVLASIIRKLQLVAGRVLNRVRIVVRETTRPLPLLAGLVADATRYRKQLLLEEALLRQQLIVASRKVKRPILGGHERRYVVMLASILPRWRDAVLLVKPETILRWQCEGYRLFWRWKSGNRKAAEPRISGEHIALIRQMAQENRIWGAERIRGELLKLGISIAKLTIAVGVQEAQCE